MNDRNLIGERLQGYTITQKLGSGGYGTVYLGRKEELGKEYLTAVKYVSLPDAEGYEAALEDYGYDRSAVQEHFEKMVAEITAEINTLLELSKKDNRYIVAYYDHEIREFENPLRFEIFMRMEYLTPLNKHIRQNGMTVGAVVKLGLNICDALSVCHANGIMHRDIKEANIFINEDGNYKLGDFGVAKAAIETTQAGSIKGTASYMAPEIYLREPYDTSVDIYSLGIVLYKLLNCQRLPFMPEAPAVFTVDDKNLAETRRLKGETPPLPMNAKNRLGEIVVKACSAKKDRYKSAEECKRELQEFLETLSWEEYNEEVVPPMAEGSDISAESTVNSYTQTQGATVTMGAQSSGQSVTPAASHNPYAKKSGKKRQGLLLVGAGALICLIIAGIIGISRVADPLERFQAAIEENDYIKAAQLYQDKLKDSGSEKVAEAGTFLVSQAENIWVKYEAGEIEYEEALNQLQEMERLGIADTLEIRQVIDQVNDMRTSRAAYESAQADMEVGDYESAIGNYRKVIAEDANYPDAQSQLTEAVKKYKEEVLGSLTELEKDKQFEEAIAALREGLLVVPDDADLLKKIEDYETKIEDNLTLEIETIVRDAKNTAYVSEDYEAALSELKAALEQYPNRGEIEAGISEIEENYATIMLGEAEALAGESEYREAVALLKDALKLVPSSQGMKDAVSEYEAKYPVLLQQLTYFTGKDLKNSGQEMDNMQEMQVNVVLTQEGSCFFDNTYKLDGQYKRITGVLYQPFNRRSDTDTNKLEIFGDGRLLYSAEMRGGREPIEFDVELTEVADFEIRLVNSHQGYWGYSKLANVQLYQ